MHRPAHQSPHGPDTLGIFLDLLLPPQPGTFPGASIVASEADYWLFPLDDQQRQCFDLVLHELEATPAEQRVQHVRRFEAAEPVLFQLIYARLLTAYYSAPAVAAHVRVLADNGPREPSPVFDPKLLDTVRKTQAGKRRL